MTWRSEIGPAGAARPQATAGFTLIEMIIVLAVLALMMTLFLVNGRPVSPATHARAAATAIAGALRSARSQAVMSNHGVLFTIDLANRQYQWGQAPPEILSGDLRLDLLTSRDQLVSGAAGSIRFNPDGSSSGGRVSLAGGNRVWWIGIDWLSGRVSIAEKPR